VTNLNKEEIRESIRTRYGQIAEEYPVKELSDCGCGCGDPTISSCCSDAGSFEDYSKTLGYSEAELKNIPEGANMGLGCGNPQAIASIQPGETVLDLGAGGGFDCFIAAKSVGKTGKVIGVDMTPSMVSKARTNIKKVNAENVEFRLGEIEHLPVEDNSVDVIISNCVVNLSPDKQQVFKDAARVLKKGGRMAIKDIIATKELPEDLRSDLDQISACIGGAEQITLTEKMLKSAGFSEVRVEPDEESRKLINQWSQGRNLGEYVVSASITAIK